MRLRFILIFIVTLLAGCGGGDDSPAGGGGDTSRIKWSYDVGPDTYIYYSSAALSQDEQTIYVGTSKKVRSNASGKDALIALNNDGSLKWKYSLTGGEEVRSSPVVAENAVCFLADYKTGEFSKNYTDLVCLNEADGVLKFSHKISDNTGMSPVGLSKPVIKDGKVFAAMKHFYAFNLVDGTELYKSAQLQVHDSYVNPVVLDNEVLFILNSQLYFYSTDNYAARTVDIGPITNSTVLATPAIDSNKNIYFGTEGGQIFAINKDGGKVWESVDFNPSNAVDGPFIRSSVALDENKGLLYVGTKHDSASKLVALSMADGVTQWEYATGGDVYSSPLLGDNGNIYFASESRYLHALNSDGNEVWRVGMSQDVTWPSPVIDSQGIIYIGGMGNGSGNGKLFAIQTDSTGLMHGSWSKMHKNNQNTGY